MATHSKTPDWNSPHKAMTRTQSQGLENVRTPTDTPVNGKGDSTSCNGSAVSKSIKCGRDAVELATAMVGDDDAVDAVFDG